VYVFRRHSAVHGPEPVRDSSAMAPGLIPRFSAGHACAPRPHVVAGDEFRCAVLGTATANAGVWASPAIATTGAANVRGIVPVTSRPHRRHRLRCRYGHACALLGTARCNAGAESRRASRNRTPQSGYCTTVAVRRHQRATRVRRAPITPVRCRTAPVRLLGTNGQAARRRDPSRGRGSCAGERHHDVAGVSGARNTHAPC